MGFLDTLLGRTKPSQANLDDLFGLPSAAVTLEAGMGLHPSPRAGICFKPPSGQPFAEVQSEITGLLSAGPGTGPPPKVVTDDYSYRWLVIEDTELSDLVTEVHMANSTLQDNGYGPQLLCSVFGFEPPPLAVGDGEGAVGGGEPAAGEGEPAAGASVPGGERLYLVYLYKRGSFYPFVPIGKEKRDNEAELRLKAMVTDDVKIEPDLTRWFPLWGLPV